MKSFVRKFTDTLKILSIKTDKKFIVFYSENRNYRNYLISVIENIASEKNFKVVYVSSDEKDKDSFVNNVEIFFVGAGIFRLLFFTLIKCDFLITSLSNLNNNIKVSKNCKKLAYIPHSLCSTHKVYEKKAFEHYDIFFSLGNYQKLELERAENLYSYKRKKIFNVGYPYLEKIKDQSEVYDANIQFKRNNIVLALSWQRNKKNLFDNYAEKIVEKLIKKNFFVTLRIHPETLKRSKKNVNSIIKKFDLNEKFSINTDLQNMECFKNSEILISDNGGVAMEFVYIYKKPVLFINYKEKIQNQDYKDISDETFEDNFKNNYCRNMNIGSLDEIDLEIQKIRTTDKSLITKSVQYIEKNINQKNPPSENIKEILKNLCK